MQKNEVTMQKDIWKRIRKKAKKPTSKGGRFGPEPNEKEKKEAWESWRNGLKV